MRNPNGYGSVVKLSGNRRRPYAVRKTVGFNDKGHPIYLCLGYTESREEGMILLAKYNSDPFNISDRNITVRELFDRWYSVYHKKMSLSMQGAMKAAWKHCSSLGQICYRKLNSYQIQQCVDNCQRGYGTKNHILNLFRHLDRFAMELDIITRKRCLLVTGEKIPDSRRVPFSEDEIGLLWENVHLDNVDIVLIFLYTGMRLSELLGIKSADVDLASGIITGGIKTQAGKNRVIPIHPRIIPLVQNRLSGNNEYLISYNNGMYSRYRYYKEWNSLMKVFGMTHTPHECRHTFRSRMDSAGANKRCIDLIMGHKSKDVGERVYTHKTIAELTEAVKMID